MEVSGDKNLVLRNLLEKAYETIKPRSVYSKCLIALWGEFVAFCNFYKLSSCLAQPETVMIFLTWLDLSSKLQKLHWYTNSISYHYHSLEIPDPTQNFNVQHLVRNCLKHAANDKEAVWLQDSFPVEALQNYINNPSLGARKQGTR
ncbi:13762_t:CDS:2 [Dentiscutata erythropus]|uniref:13762_t:CDS:1 n=1 Tax=Dentiscutata erythropus TaxID=1348616 RepID=A0A9N9DIW2_9GLOM|nr:13762_t:CDS:2 [Dentiscutata erythropus]